MIETVSDLRYALEGLGYKGVAHPSSLFALAQSYEQEGRLDMAERALECAAFIEGRRSAIAGKPA